MQNEQISMVIRSQIYFLMIHQDVVLRVLMAERKLCTVKRLYHTICQGDFFMCDHLCKELPDGCIIFVFVYGSLITWY